MFRPEHRPPRGQGWRHERAPFPEEQDLRRLLPELDAYLTALKRRGKLQTTLALRQLLRMAREYPREPLLAAIQTAAHYGLYDLGRLERMVLRGIATTYFQLPLSVLAGRPGRPRRLRRAGPGGRRARHPPIAAGEYHYGIVPFRHLLEARSIDIVMVDLLRVGGITQWMKVAGMAEAFNLPVVSHLVPEIHVHLVAAAPNGLTVEYMPWSLRLFEQTPAIEDGQLVVPNKPGLGLAFDQAAIKRYQVG